MKVILTTRVQHLGQPWELKEVKNGYARNFLFPRSLAIPATKQSIERAKKLQEQRVKHVEEMKANAAEMSKKLSEVKLSFKRKARGSKLYGSIAEKDICDALAQGHKMEIGKEMVRMEHIKTMGSHSVVIHLAEGVEVKLPVTVEAE